MKKRNQIESSHQQTLIEWFHLQYPGQLIYCIPNQLIRDRVQAIIMTKRGLVGGIPDVCIAVPRKPWHCLYVELKVPELRGTACGGLTVAQNRIIALLNANGYKAEVCYGVEHGIEVISAYMSLSDEW